MVTVEVPSPLSPEPQMPGSSRTILVCFAHAQLEPRVSGCERDCVCWPFKGVHDFLGVPGFSLGDRNPTAFHSPMLCGHLLQALVPWAGEPILGLRSQAYQGERPTPEISLQKVSCGPREWGQPFSCFCTFQQA